MMEFTGQYKVAGASHLSFQLRHRYCWLMCGASCFLYRALSPAYYMPAKKMLKCRVCTKNQITAKDRTISSLRRKINDDKDAVTACEEAIRQYGELEAETQSVLLKVRAELDDHDKRSDMLWNYTKQIEIFNVLELNIYLDKFY